MAVLPLIQFNNWRDREGYRLENTGRVIVRNGKRKDNFDVLSPLKNEALYGEFANTSISAEGLLKFVECHGPLTERGNDQGEIVHQVLWHAERMRDALKLRSLQRLRRGRDTGFGFPFVPLRAGISWEPPNGLRWVIRPNSLVDGLWLQFGQAITRGVRIQACVHCGQWFEVGYPSRRRLDSKFCSDEHRVQYNSRQRSKGE